MGGIPPRALHGTWRAWCLQAPGWLSGIAVERGWGRYPVCPLPPHAPRQAMVFAKNHVLEHGPIILEMDTYRCVCVLCVC